MIYIICKKQTNKLTIYINNEKNENTCNINHSPSCSFTCNQL
jgi:hypothetical protein